MDDLGDALPVFLDRFVTFPSGRTYEIVRPITKLRSCHDGTPAEACIVCTGKRIKSTQSDAVSEQEEFILKIKCQEPANSGDAQPLPEQGPSTTTAAELEALGMLARANSADAPHLVDWKRDVQGDDGPLPAGYLTYTVMTKVPGDTLWNLKYWGFSPAEREEICREFIKTLRAVYALGIEPIDRALRNVVWEPETKKCSIIDFELWRPAHGTFADEIVELQRWGLHQRPVKTWMEAWGMGHR